MKVALLLSGKFRNSKQFFALTKSNILDTLSPDVFISTWENQEEIIDANYESIYPKTDCNLNEILEFYNPILHETEKFSELNLQFYLKLFKKEPIDISPEMISNRTVHFFSMWYKRWKVNLLKSQWEKKNNFVYDIVIMSRFDLEFLEPLELKEDINSVMIPKGYDFHGGIGDLFVYSNSQFMDNLIEIFPYMCKTFFEPTTSEGMKNSAHVYFLEFLKSKKIPYERFLLKYKLRNSEVWNTEVNSE